MVENTDAMRTTTKSEMSICPVKKRGTSGGDCPRENVGNTSREISVSFETAK